MGEGYFITVFLQRGCRTGRTHGESGPRLKLVHHMAVVTRSSLVACRVSLLTEPPEGCLSRHAEGRFAQRPSRCDLRGEVCPQEGGVFLAEMCRPLYPYDLTL